MIERTYIGLLVCSKRTEQAKITNCSLNLTSHYSHWKYMNKSGAYRQHLGSHIGDMVQSPTLSLLKNCILHLTNHK